MQLANTPLLQSTAPGLQPVSIHHMAPPVRGSKHPITCTAYYSIYRPRKDERLSRPAWLVTCRNKVPPPGVAAARRDCVSQLQQQYRLTEFGRCCGISVFTRNSVKFRGNTEIPRQRPNSAARLEIPRLAENCGPYSLHHLVNQYTIVAINSWHLSTLCRMRKFGSTFPVCGVQPRGMILNWF